jgi:hypothetical protein
VFSGVLGNTKQLTQHLTEGHKQANMKNTYNVTLKFKFNPNRPLVTGCHNRVDASNALEAINKVMSFHGYTMNDIEEASVILRECFPSIE